MTRFRPTPSSPSSATVFVRVQGTNWKGSGSGFVVATDKDTVLVATNYHVITGPGYEKNARPTPTELAKAIKAPTVSVVFDSGTKTEVAAKAEVIAGDAENDLAILRITGLKDPPKPIEYTDPPKLSETMAVYTFGFPFGQALSTGKGSPAITVGKGSVSSLRLNDDGELAVVQIDGALNPGNSGGPVVDTKGRLVGVAVATIKNAQGIGFAVPCAELGRMMKGRLDGFLVSATKGADGKLTVRAEVGVLDPTAAVKGVTLHYLVVPPKGTKPKAGESLEKQPGAKKVALKVAGGIATGDVTLDAAEGDLYVQAVPDGGAGAAGASRVRDFSLLLPKGTTGAVVLDPAGTLPAGPGAGEVPAPAGWKEYTATNKTFMVWVPDKLKGQNEKQHTLVKPPNRLTFNAIVAETPGGVTYIVEQVLVAPRPGKQLDRDEIMAMLRDVALGDAPGAKVTREVDAKMGKFPGKEFLVERGVSATRARGFVIGSSIYLLRVIGTKDQVESPDGKTFLESCRLQVPNRPPVGPIAGGRDEPEFKDAVPPGAVLVGLELGVGKLGPNVVVKSVRAVYRVGDRESFGAVHGATAPGAAEETVKIVAKPGYAVGAISAKTGAALFGLSLTFMKTADGKLDPKDSYESAWSGNKDQAGAITIGGAGEAAAGLTGGANADAVLAIGLLYGDIERKPVVPIPPPVARAEGRGPRIQGGPFDPEYRDATPPGGALVGLEVGLGKFVNNDVVKALRPVYRIGDKESLGEQYGTELNNVVKVIAKPGYAVGAVTLKTGLGIDGLSITFMKVLDGKLDPKDNYESEWVGSVRGGGPVKIGDGTLVVGVLVKANPKDVHGLGLIYVDTNKPGLDGVWPAGVPSKIQGGGGDREFREAGADGTLLVGLEVGVGRFVNNPVIKAVRPVFRAGDKDSLGEWHGGAGDDIVKEVVKFIAKPGYAVGAITLKTGLGIDGLSVTFMKVVDGKLDPNDTYESEWVGGMGGGGPVKIGDGTPVTGLIGKARADTVSGLGLLHPPAKK